MRWSSKFKYLWSWFTLCLAQLPISTRPFRCPHCGHTYPSRDYRFCPHCGHPLQGRPRLWGFQFHKISILSPAVIVNSSRYGFLKDKRFKEMLRLIWIPRGLCGLLKITLVGRYGYFVKQNISHPVNAATEATEVNTLIWITTWWSSYLH